VSQLEHLKKATETELRRFYVAACTKKFLDVRLFIRNVMTMEIEDRHVHAGIKGQADVWGHLFRDPYPMPLEIELKNVNTRDTDQQKKWRAYCERNRVPYLYMRAQKNDTPVQVIADWVRQTDDWLKYLRTGEYLEATDGTYKFPPMVTYER
jgi:hypothetical protein